MADASRVLLGLGGCVDYEVKLTSGVLEQLVAEYGIAAAELTSPVTVTSERDLVVSILGYVARDGGASTSSPPPRCWRPSPTTSPAASRTPTTPT
ncbi:hypothetical protein [Micromonospora radicis]|uniref:hypothetical protein n=1 Tax=Micromonospora radicis TaxID=1894971 RepID=UPI0013142624|nr:hypothetical protein [Micromonospora radicis]